MFERNSLHAKTSDLKGLDLSIIFGAKDDFRQRVDEAGHSLTEDDYKAFEKYVSHAFHYDDPNIIWDHANKVFICERISIDHFKDWERMCSHPQVRRVWLMVLESFVRYGVTLTKRHTYPSPEDMIQFRTKAYEYWKLISSKYGDSECGSDFAAWVADKDIEVLTQADLALHERVKPYFYEDGKSHYKDGYLSVSLRLLFAWADTPLIEGLDVCLLPPYPTDKKHDEFGIRFIIPNDWQERIFHRASSD